MPKNSENFSMQDIMRIAQSPAGQQLMAMLTKANPVALETAMQQASGGNYSEVQKTLQAFTNNSDIKRIIQQMGE